MSYSAYSGVGLDNMDIMAGFRQIPRILSRTFQEGTDLFDQNPLDVLRRITRGDDPPHPAGVPTPRDIMGPPRQRPPAVSVPEYFQQLQNEYAQQLAQQQPSAAEQIPQPQGGQPVANNNPFADIFSAYAGQQAGRGVGQLGALAAQLAAQAGQGISQVLPNGAVRRGQQNSPLARQVASAIGYGAQPQGLLTRTVGNAAADIGNETARQQGAAFANLSNPFTALGNLAEQGGALASQALEGIQSIRPNGAVLRGGVPTGNIIGQAPGQGADLARLASIAQQQQMGQQAAANQQNMIGNARGGAAAAEAAMRARLAQNQRPMSQPNRVLPNGAVVRGDPVQPAVQPTTSPQSPGVDPLQARRLDILENLVNQQGQGASEGRQQQSNLVNRVLGESSAAQERARQANETRYQDILEGYQNRQSEYEPALNRALGRVTEGFSDLTGLAGDLRGDLAGVTQGYQDRFERNMGHLEGFGSQMREDIDRRMEQARARQRGTLVSAGLGNTTVQTAADRGIAETGSAEQRRLGEQLARLRLETDSALSGDALAAQEREATQGFGAESTARQNALEAARQQALTGFDAGSRMSGERLNFMERRTDQAPDPAPIMALLQALGQQSGQNQIDPQMLQLLLASLA